MTGMRQICRDLPLEKKAFAHLATVMPDGSPQNTPVWFDRSVPLRGSVRRVRQDDVATAPIDQPAHKYLGLDKTPYATTGEVGVMFEISVFSVQGMSRSDRARDRPCRGPR